MEDLHSWVLSPEQAVQIQQELRRRLVLAWDGRAVHRVGGVDVSFPAPDQARAAIVVFSYPDLAPVEAVTAQVPVGFPYIPGLLTFREGPAVLAAWRQLKNYPDLVLFDGQGIAHPRGIGIAAHIGLWIDTPSIGVAKSFLYGRYSPPGLQRGDYAWLTDRVNREQVIGVVLRTKDNTKPLYISPGQSMDVPHAMDFVLNCCTHYRLPEPTRWAHRVAGGEAFPP